MEQDEIYFGQYKDEKLINKYLNKDPSKNKGIYVDIGACDPLFLSNTYYYYRLGWHGLAIDSFSGVEEKFKKIRPRDTFLRVAVTNYNGEATMYGRAIENSMVGERYKKQYKQGVFKIKCLTMDSIFAKYPEFCMPDFMSMDIETNEEKALSKCNFNTFKPRIVYVEHSGEGIDQRPFWEHYLTPFYDFKEILAGNALYLRRKDV